MKGEEVVIRGVYSLESKRGRRILSEGCGGSRSGRSCHEEMEARIMARILLEESCGG